jgi:hypothetical protein
MIALKTILPLLTALLLAPLAPLRAADTPQPAGKPNVLLIVCDDLTLLAALLLAPLAALNLARALPEVPRLGILRVGFFQAFEIAYVWTRRQPGVTKSA